MSLSIALALAAILASPEQPKPTLLVAPLQAEEAEQSDAAALAQLISALAGNSQKYTLVTPEDMSVIDTELVRQLAGGCAEASCIANLGGALGAQFAITGAYSRLGTRYMLTLKLVDIETVRALRTASIQALGVEGVADLLPPKLATLLGDNKGSPNGPPNANATSGPVIAGAEIGAVLGWINATGSPVGTTVRIRGAAGLNEQFVLARAAPWLKRVVPGKYQWKAWRDGYVTEQGSLTVRTDETSVLNVKLKKPASLKIHGAPLGAKVMISGPHDLKVTKGLPVTLAQVPPGAYTVRVSRPGYRSEDRTIELQPGKQARMRFDLFKQSGSGGASKGPDPKQVLAAARQTIRTDPGNGKAYFDMGWAQLQMNQFDAARQSLSKSLALEGPVGAWFQLGLAYQMLGDNENAVKLFNRFIELAPDHPKSGAARALAESLR